MKSLLKLAAVPILITIVFIVSSCSASPLSTSTQTQPTTFSSTQPPAQPINVVSVTGPLPPINPGGPNVDITLKNVSDTPVVSLSALLGIPNVQNKPFLFNFSVSTVKPLLPGADTSYKMALIGGGFSSDINYPVEIEGSFQTGETFDFTVQVNVVPPPAISTTSTIPVPDQTSVTGTNASGLSLTLSVNAATYHPGDQITITVDEKNTLATENNIKASDEWPVKGLNLGPCGTINYPFGVLVLQGDYGATDLTSISPLQLFDPDKVYSCPLILAGITAYDFQPGSDMAAIYTDSGLNSTIKMNASVDAPGYWSGSPKATFSNFAPGTYTVVGGDEWGTLVVLHFTVS